MFQIRQLFLYRVSSDFSQDLMVKFLVSYRVKNMSLQHGSRSQLLKVTLLWICVCWWTSWLHAGCIQWRLVWTLNFCLLTDFNRPYDGCIQWRKLVWTLNFARSSKLQQAAWRMHRTEACLNFVLASNFKHNLWRILTSEAGVNFELCTCR